MTTPQAAPRQDDVQIRRDDDRGRYWLLVDGAHAGEADFTRSGVVLTVHHVGVERAREGNGLGGRFAQAVLDDLRARGEKVVPVCPFLHAWIGKHPAYADLVAA
ncbi:MAG TPA: GNAT family N-acetyltransferase [Frankiaceae bacterium]